MRVVHLSTADIRGGAARGSYGLHRALLGLGIDSRMVVQFKESNDPTVIADQRLTRHLVHGVRRRIDRTPLLAYRNRSDALFSAATVPGDVTRRVAAQEPDIVHLHWVARSFVRPEDLASFRTPVVWTLRDLWPFTGGCHYSQGCDRYRLACGECPILGSESDTDLSSWLLARKVRAYRGVDLTPVALSGWMRDHASGSSAFADVSVRMIHNGVDTDVWFPRSSGTLRSRLSIAPDAHVMLFIALHLNETHKGFKEFAEACRLLAADGGSGIHAVVVGDPAGDVPRDLGLPVSWLGPVEGDPAIRDLYSSATLTVVPSTEEAFGKTAAESLACGTPVVCFSGTGVADIVAHKVTGFLADPFLPASLAEGVRWVLDADAHQESLRVASRAAAERDFSVQAQAERYVGLYSELLARRRS